MINDLEYDRYTSPCIAVQEMSDRYLRFLLS